MADFQELDLTTIKHKTLFKSIRKLLLQKYPFESGGLVDQDLNILYHPSLKNSCHCYFPPDEFYLDLIRKPILFSFHSHLHLLKPSEEDIFFLKSYDFPVIIYSLNYNSFLSVNINNETSGFTWYTKKIDLPDV